VPDVVASVSRKERQFSSVEGRVNQTVSNATRLVYSALPERLDYELKIILLVCSNKNKLPLDG
jgi:hypothetical protein